MPLDGGQKRTPAVQWSESSGALPDPGAEEAVRRAPRRSARSTTAFISRYASISNITWLPAPAATWLEGVSAVMVCLGTALAVVETMSSVQEWEGHTKGNKLALLILDLIITSFFIVEYIVRVIVAIDPCKFVFSFFGMVDGLVAASCLISFVVQSYVHKAMPIIRIVRLVRIFRFLKLLACVEEAHTIQRAIRQNARALLVYLFFVAVSLLLVSIALFIAEGEGEGFESMPHCIWWAVVTLTTVGYGDTVPQSFLGRVCAMAVMLLGYGLLAVPTIVSSLDAGKKQQDSAASSCPERALGPRFRHCKSGSEFGLETDVYRYGSEAEQGAGAGSLGSALTELSSGQSRHSFDFFVSLTTSPDHYGRPHCVVIHGLIDTAVCAFLTQAVNWDLSAMDLPLPHVTETSCRFLQRAPFRDPLEVGVGLEDVSQMTCTYCVAFFPKGRKAPCAVAQVVHAWVEPCSRLPCSVPRRLQAFDPRSPSLNLTTTPTSSLG